MSKAKLPSGPFGTNSQGRRFKGITLPWRKQMRVKLIIGGLLASTVFLPALAQQGPTPAPAPSPQLSAWKRQPP